MDKIEQAYFDSDLLDIDEDNSFVIFKTGYKSANLLPTEKICSECGGRGIRDMPDKPLLVEKCPICGGAKVIQIYYTPEQYRRITDKDYPDDAMVFPGVYLTNTVISRNPIVCEESNFDWRQPIPYEDCKDMKYAVIVQTAQPVPPANYRPED